MITSIIVSYKTMERNPVLASYSTAMSSMLAYSLCVLGALVASDYLE